MVLLSTTNAEDVLDEMPWTHAPELAVPREQGPPKDTVGTAEGLVEAGALTPAVLHLFLTGFLKTTLRLGRQRRSTRLTFMM